MPASSLAAPPATRWIDAEREGFRARFEREPFAFAHRLAGHPLFTLDRLIGVAEALRDEPDCIVYDAGAVGIGQRWSEVPFCGFSVRELLAHMETAKAWIVLKHVDRLAGYGAVFAECTADVEGLAGRDFSRMFSDRKAIVFVNSPNRVTSYHIDHQSTFLLQLRGTKTISIFDRADREVLPNAELERFWLWDHNAAVYKPALQHRAQVFELVPGMGVHIPVNAPHWVQNGPDVSVSLNFNFDLPDGVLGDTFRANYWLRKVGLNPPSPRHDVLGPSFRGIAFGAIRRLRGRMGQRR